MTNDQTPDLNLIIKIEKLLAQSEDPTCSPAEREAFQAKAFELIERHRIDRALIGGHLAADDIIVTDTVGDFNGIYGRVRIEIVDAVARAFDTKLFWTGYQNTRRLKAYGFRSDVDQVIALSNRLLSDADLRVQFVEPPEYVDMYNSSGGRYRSRVGAVQAATIRERRGFYSGYADEIARRLRAAQQAAKTSATEAGVDVTSAALVLVDRKRQVNDQFRSQVSTRAANGIDGGGSGGYSRGQDAGRNADLSHSNQVGSRKALGR
jgi:hypothetical protein